MIRTLLTVLVLSLLSTPVFAEWTKVSENADSTFYVDFDKIRKRGGYVYYWELGDYLKPNHKTRIRELSAKIYFQGDCELFRLKVLSWSQHKEPMGEGTGVTESPKNPEWYYPVSSKDNTILKRICKYAK
jgi:hypothetical protein